MALLSAENILVGGLVNPTLAAAAGGGDTFPNDGERTIFVVDNGGGGGITVTFDDSVSVSPESATSFDADVVSGTIGAGEVGYFGPFDVNRFTRVVGVTYSGVSSVTVGVFKVGAG